MIPALLNSSAGGAEAAARRLAADARFALQPFSPADLPQAIEKHIRRGARRVLVAGGDGTLATAAGALLHGPVELAVLPAGTRNHFARSLGLPADLDQAIEIATGDATRTVDVGRVNGHLFLNTSSVGAYVALVRQRERLEPYLGYSLAGLASAMRLLLRLRRFTLELEVQGNRQRYRTPLLFVGVGERDLSLPGFGERRDGGGAVLHTIVVRGKRRARLLALALATATSGIWRVAQTPHVDSFLVQHCRVEVPRRTVHVAIDGEILRLRPPLAYGILRHALTVVAPPPPART